MILSAFNTGAWILIIGYALLILWLVFKGAGKTKSLSDFALGSIFFSPVAVGLSLAASMTSAATFVINPGFIANYGWSAMLSFGIILPVAAIASLVIMTKSFRKYGQTVKALTLAQWIGTRYGSPAFAFFMAVLSLLLITFIVLICVAISKVLAGALGLSEVVVLGALVVFVFGYMMFGGANAMVYTNTIQAIIMIIVAIVLIFSGLPWLKEGWSGFISQLNNIDPSLVNAPNPSSPLFRSWYEIGFAQLIVGIAIVVQPHIITKSLLLKKESDVNTFILTAVLVQMLFFAVVFVGFYARLTFPDLLADGQKISNDGIVTAYVLEVFSDGTLGIAIGLLVIMGLIGAGFSTLEGLVQSVSTTITSDILRPVFPKFQSLEKNQMISNRFVIVLLGVVTFLLSYKQLMSPDLSVGIFAQNGVYAYFSAAFIPVLLGLFVKNIPFYIPFIAAIVAVLTHFSIYYALPWVAAQGYMEFGWFGTYLSGKVRNPAIASSTAILLATLSALSMMAWIKLPLTIKKDSI